MRSELKTMHPSAMTEYLPLQRHPIPTWVLSAPTLQAIFTNNAALQWLGFKGEEMENRSWLSLLDEKEEKHFITHLITHTDASPYPGKLKGRTGKVFYADIYVVPFEKEGGRFYQLSAVDVTEKTKQYEELEQDRLRYQGFIGQSSEGIFCQEFHMPIPIDQPVDAIIRQARANSHIAECNDALARMYGYESAKDMKGLGTEKLIDFDSDANRAYFTAFIQNGFRVTDAESLERDRHGNPLYFLNNAIGIVENGCLKRVWGLQRDITGQKRTEADLKFLASLVEQTSDILTAADIHFHPVSWNKAAERVYGVTAEEALGNDLRKFIDFEYHGATRDQIREILTREGEWRGEASFIRRADKKLVTVLIGFKALRNEEGTLTGYLISATDITDRIESESRLRESEQRFREMADSAPVMIWMTDEKNVTTYINQAWIEFTGQDIQGDPEGWSSLVHPEDLPRAYQSYKDAYELKRPVTLEYRLRRSDGIYHWVHDVSVPRFLADGSFVGYIGSVLDIEEEKRKREQLLYQSTILENVSDIVVTTDLDYKVTLWNNIAEFYYGIPAEKAIGERMFDLVKMTYINSSQEEAMRALNEKGMWIGEVSIVNATGETLHFLHTVKYMRDEEENHIGFLAVGRDITRMKRAEMKMKKSEEFYRTLIADSLDGMLLLDAEGKISFASPAVKNVLGYSIEDVLGKNAFDFVHPEDIRFAFDSFQKEVVENPEVKFIVVRLLKKSGEWLWCMVRGHNMLNKPNINSIVIYFHDDTLRKQAGEALRESERRFRTLIRDLQTGVLLQDAEGKILMSNNAMQSIFGDPEESLVGKKIWEVYNESIKEDGSPFTQVERPSYLALQTRQRVNDVVMGVWHPKRNEYIWLIISVDPILDEEGNLRHMVCSFTDITERKKLEQRLIAEKVLRQKQLTKASIEGQEKERKEIGKELHDNIGQQLTTIKLFLDMAKTTADEATFEMLNLALKGVSDAINEVRAMSRALVPSTLKDLGLVESIQELVDSFHRTQLMQIRFEESDFFEDEIPEIQKLTLFRIVQEQLNNIVKHAGAKNVEILLCGQGQNLHLEVRDDGRGFDPVKVRKGLGFMNIKNRAELFEGKAEIHSSPGKGCTLQVSMPYSFGDRVLT